MKVLELKPIQGHIMLLCKGHYKYSNFLNAIRMIWAVRCGLEKQYTIKGQADQHIADELVEILHLTRSKDSRSISEAIHGEITNTWKYEGLTPLEILITIYKSQLSMVKIRDVLSNPNRVKTLIKLPKRNKRVFNRILRGNGRYTDYELITK